MTEERELQQVRDTLSNMIVHDLRSPLSSMLAGLHLMRDRLTPEQQTPLIRQSLEVAIRSCNKMIGLVSTLLDISRMETGDLEIHRRPVQFSLLVDEVLADLTPLANDQGLVLLSDVPPVLPSVLADPDKLNRVLTNLIDNALKFSPPGGQVLVRAEVLAAANGAATNGRAKPGILCSVLDSGPGIPADYRDRVFDRFVQVQGQKGRREGTGLGLTFCKMAVEAHGGRIWAENRPEGGSAFCFTLPLEPGTAP
jgi:signal transduction histidine kinase